MPQEYMSKLADQMDTVQSNTKSKKSSATTKPASSTENLMIIKTLAAGANDTTTLRVTPPKSTEAKNGYTLIVKATSEDDSTITTRNIFINVLQIYEVSVQVSGESSKKGDPGDELIFEMTVKNKGNGEDTVSLSLEGAKASWASIVDEVELASGESKTVNLTVNIDDDATVGDYDIIVNGTAHPLRDHVTIRDLLLQILHSRRHQRARK